MLRSFRIMDAEPCPCGSNKPYKDCCKHKEVTPPLNSKIPPQVQIMNMMRSSLEKRCLHPDKCNCKGKIKAAHALQHNKIISLLADNDRNVYVLDFKRQPVLVPLDSGEVVPFAEITKTSASKATTETCFCDLHDNVVFSSIESGAPDFDNSDEMKFTYAYKAFIFEYYKQMMAMQIYRKCFSQNPRAFRTKEETARYRMLQLRSKEFEPVKDHFDSEILSGNHGGIYTCAIEIPQQISFADYAYIAPTYDMNGRRIKHTKRGVMHRLALTIFPEKNRSWLLLSCLNTEKDIYDSLFAQMKEASLEKIKLYLNYLLPLYSENMVLSPDLWENWSEEAKLGYAFYANLNGRELRTMDMYIKFTLRNAHREKSEVAYKTLPAFNLFP